MSSETPHVRGEDELVSPSTTLMGETPPRAWGRHSGHSFRHAGRRNTPTCVGKTHHARRHAYVRWKHPHVRGEDPCEIIENLSGRETPPRAWGRPVMVPQEIEAVGNTPTCVGKTFLAVRQTLAQGNTPTCVGKTLRDYSLFLLSRQNNIEASSFSDTSCSPDNSMSWRFGSPMP